MKTTTDQTEKKTDGGADEAHGPAVEFLDLLTNKEVKFDAKWTETLRKAWETAYTLLNETRSPEDKLLCADKGSVSLMEYLELTFEQLREKKICPDRKYKIRRPTGGA